MRVPCTHGQASLSKHLLEIIPHDVHVETFAFFWLSISMQKFLLWMYQMSEQILLTTVVLGTYTWVCFSRLLVTYVKTQPDLIKDQVGGSQLPTRPNSSFRYFSQLVFCIQRYLSHWVRWCKCFSELCHQIVFLWVQIERAKEFFPTVVIYYCYEAYWVSLCCLLFLLPAV